MSLRLSVIVPVFNGASLISNCLAALNAQQGIDRADYEIIVVDDGSTDDTAAQAENLCDRLVRLDANQGAAAARNRGAAAAAAPLLLFVDADVVLEPDAVKQLLDLFDRRPEISAAVGRYADLPAAPGLVNLYHNHFTVYHHDLSPPEIDWFWGAIGAVKKADFDQAGGFDERYQGASAEDMEFGRALAATGALIVYEPSIRGAHGHHFSLSGMLQNDYKKAVLGVKLRLQGRLPLRAPGFANPRSAVTLVLIFVLPPTIILALNHREFWFAAGFMGAFIQLLNYSFYRQLQNLAGGTSFFFAGLLHWMQLLAIGAGAVSGILGHLLGRDTFGRPGWI